MTNKHIVKVQKILVQLWRRGGRKWKLIIFFAGAILIIGAAWWMAPPRPQNYETEIPAPSQSYSAVPIAEAYQKETGGLIKIKFNPLNSALDSMPEYSIKEIPGEAKTVIIFDKVARVDGEFNYQEISSIPLIDLLDYKIDNNRLVLEIWRKGAYLPAKITANNSTATIVLSPATDDYPVVSNQKPSNDSIVYPMLHTISFEAVLKSSLKNANILLQGKPVKFQTDQFAPNEYRFSFNQNVETDQEYTAKAIITDQDGRTAVSVWTFSGQIPSAAALGNDRFKYLGWWGEINANGVAVRKGMAITSDKIGTMSTANRVKILKEVYGDWVDGKNLWYQIDGGAYPGAYIFSDFVTPMVQPEPPKSFSIPAKVETGEKWIDVDLSKKILTLFDYDKPIFATYISPGRAENPTQTGVYRIWYKLSSARMVGGPPLHKYKYDLKNIPWTMFYNYDYAIHGTYWHDKFGTQQSAGCTNMTQGDAKYIFDNTLPQLPQGEKGVFAREKPNSGQGTGTLVYNHLSATTTTEAKNQP